MKGKRAAAFSRTLPRLGWVLQGALLALCLIPVSTSAAPQTAPQQMLYFTMPLDPLDTEGPTPLRVTASWLELPDLRHGQILRLSWWTRVAPSHAARFALDYVGLERGEDFQYGGGRATFGWTSRIGGVQKRSLAIDLDGNLPTGDPELHPLSARAPMARVRVRASVIAQPRYQVWLGWSAQRVSPPSEQNREVPIEWFASVSSYEVAMRYATSIADAEFSWRFDTGGVIDAHWIEAHADLPFSEDLALRVGVAGGYGQRRARLANLVLELGLSWRPAASADAP